MKNTFFLLCIAISFTSCQLEPTLFTKISSEDSGIDFSNRIMENDSINILSYDYVYNGGGVAIADFNNDGLQDIFFSANQAGNRMYINEGEMKFKDISQSAGISSSKKWCTSAITVDINHDGWMDIYVPVTSTNKAEPKMRENLLYINQKNLTFKEMGAEYGVNDNGFSEGAAFFDYDNDGDLDLYVLTNVIDQSPNYFRPKVTDGSYLNNDRLYKNEWNEDLGHPVYTDVSKQAGILIEGFGLGINICDINRDGWKDIYVTNDYAADDILYINNQNGTFTDRAKNYFKHTSYSAMGNDVADINNDGLADMLALDMMPKDNERKKMFVSATNQAHFMLSDQHDYTYQYMRNTLQLNSGLEADFSEIGLLAGVAETDWSWCPSLADFDNDGFRDLLITNGFPKDVTDKDFMQYRANSEQVADKKYLLSQIPQIRINNYAYKNNGNLQFEDVTHQWGLDVPSFSSGAAYGDLDNDGDLDYVVNNTNDSAFVFKNNTIETKQINANYLKIKFKGNAKNPFGYGTILEGITTDNQPFFFESTPYRGYKSSVEASAHIGLGTASELKELSVIWFNGKMQRFKNVKANQTLTFSIENAIENYLPTKTNADKKIFVEQLLDDKHEELPFLDFNIQNLMPHRMSQLGPGVAVADVNNDGLEDVFVGGAKFKSGKFLMQQPNGSFLTHKLTSMDSLTKRSEDTGVLLFDADGDKKIDLYIVSGGNEDYPNATSFQDRLYKNKGNGVFELQLNALPKNYNAGAAVRAIDYDKDGDLDLFVAGRNTPTQYPKATSSTILRNDSKNGNVKFVDVTKQLCPALIDIGMATDALWTDYDNDGDYDLAVVGEFMPIRFFENKAGKFSESKKSGLSDVLGGWNSINGGDFDNDGDIDYIVGNIGLNALFKGTKEYPAKLLSGDFDTNGNYDVIPFIYLPMSAKESKKELVPFNGKEDISKQYNPMRLMYTSYKEYANATFMSILTAQERKNAVEHTLNYNASVYVQNLGNGEFKLSPLPIYAQTAPINGLLIDDFNSDGNLDILCVGNNFANELLVGKYDAMNGLLLEGNGKGDFKVNLRSGFKVSGDAKALVSVVSNGKTKVMAFQNQGSTHVFEVQRKGKTLISQKNRVSYLFKGKRVLRELYNGASYLSQSSRVVFIPEGATQIQEK